MRGRVLALLLVSGIVSVAHADPITRIGLIAGARFNFGDLGDHYSWGGFGGIQAGVQPGWLGVVWSWQWNYMKSSNDLNSEPSVQLWEMDFAARARVKIKKDIPTYLYAQGGLDIVRASTSIQNQVNFLGPSAGGGLELSLGPYVFCLGADYGLLVGGPTGVKVLMYFGAGSR